MDSDAAATLMAKLAALRQQYRLAVAAGDEKMARELHERECEIAAQLAAIATRKEAEAY